MTFPHKLPVAFKAAWLAALRDPSTKQATGALCRDDAGFCCLGIACNVVPGYELQHRRGSWETHTTHDPGMPHSGDLPDDIMFALDQSTVDDISLLVKEHLANMNDSGSDFITIAAWIEENL